MTNRYLVRFSSMGSVGAFRAVEPLRFPRGRRVVLRTVRGLEVGEVLAALDEEGDRLESDGELLRPVTPEDDLLLARLERNRHEAIEACSRRLVEQEIPAMLVDVEHLFDGQSLYFYFLGEVTPAIEQLTAELAELYETRVQFRQFTESVIAGCGPTCGTAESTGCGTAGGCAACAVACGSKK